MHIEVVDGRRLHGRPAGRSDRWELELKSGRDRPLRRRDDVEVADHAVDQELDRRRGDGRRRRRGRESAVTNVELSKTRLVMLLT